MTLPKLAEFHERMKTWAQDFEWDSPAQLVIVAPDGGTELVSMLVEGNPVDYLPKLLVEKADKEPISQVAFICEAWVRHAKNMEEVRTAERLEVRFVISFDRNQILDSQYYREMGQWDDIDRGNALDGGRIPEIIRTTQALLKEEVTQ